MYFRNERLRKTSLHKCVKGRVSEDTLNDTMANGLKHCFNLNDRPFAIFNNQCEDNCVGKSLF